MRRIYLTERQLTILKESFGRGVDADTIDSVEYFINKNDDEVTYDIECWDMDGDQVFQEYDMSIEDITSALGERIASMVANGDGRNSGNYKWLDNICYRGVINNTDVNEVNALAKKLFKTASYYFEEAHGYILTDGTILSLGYEDHNSISRIEGMTINKFLELGNIRMSSNSFQLIKEPTQEQEYILQKLITCSHRNGQAVYVDISEYDTNEKSLYPNTIASYMYRETYADYILSDIRAYFEEGKMLGESIKRLQENIELEVAPSEVNVSSLEQQETLQQDIWQDNMLNSKIRLKLLDIADDFIAFLNLKWIKPIDIVLTGSICGYNWSDYSDIDMHVILDFNEIDTKVDLVREYLDMKKNEWNEAHDNLNMFGFKVECYVEHKDDKAISNGIYSLNKNKWIKKPSESSHDLTELQMVKVKLVTSSIMTKIDDLIQMFYETQDEYELRSLDNEVTDLLVDIKQLRKKGLELDGEQSTNNLSYKLLRRFGYLDKIWDIKHKIYDKINSLD